MNKEQDGSAESSGVDALSLIRDVNVDIVLDMAIDFGVVGNHPQVRKLIEERSRRLAPSAEPPDLRQTIRREHVVSIDSFGVARFQVQADARLKQIRLGVRLHADGSDVRDVRVVGVYVGPVQMLIASAGADPGAVNDELRELDVSGRTGTMFSVRFANIDPRWLADALFLMEYKE